MRLVGSIGLCALLVAGCGDAEGDGSCQEFGSTLEAIEEAIFEARGCTASACHGQPSDTAPNGLDLRPGFAYESLVSVASQAADMERVFPGDQLRSVLYLKLAAKTRTDIDLAELGVSGGAMPAGNAPALSEDELSAISAWIRGGASETALVAGTDKLFKCDDPVSVDPNKIEPLTVPDPSVGAQFYSGAYPLPAQSENENCFVTHYDFSDFVPADVRFPCNREAWGPDRECFAYRRSRLAQDAQSHHSIITVYTPKSDPTDPAWGEWRCLGGDRAGEACNPVDAGACGARSNCSTKVETSVACTGYEHAPAGFGGLSLDGTSATRIALTGAQESTFVDDPAEGVYSVQPIDGFVAWNSHAFNLTDQDTSIEQWVNVDFVRDADRRWERRQIFDVSRIFGMGQIPPFESTEICMSFTVPQFTRLMTMSSHTHQHGQRFRIWAPSDNPDGITPCTQPTNPVTDLFGIDPNCQPEAVEPMYTSLLYNDPLYLYFDPPLAYDSPDEADRTFKACAFYDNGDDDPATLYRNSTASQSILCEDAPFGRATCGCAPEARACVGGSDQGMPCGGDDSACGDGGVCDACPVQGGLTTNDEMFVPLGSFFVQPPG